MGCEDGVVRCFDAECKALGWNEDLDAGSITSISFASLVIRTKLHLALRIVNQ
jgi:hypothetical protein